MTVGGSAKNRLIWAAVALTVVVTVGIGALLTHVRHHDAAVVAGPQFPVIDRSALAPVQTRVLDIVETQWRTQPAATTFTEGVDEPWCADFVSWVMREAGVALRNPNSGSWRIPGVYTLKEAFQAAGRFELPAAYRPQPGDVVLWGPDSPMGLHANIVVAADAMSVTTVGGNEGGIALRRSIIGDMTGLLGYGKLR